MIEFITLAIFTLGLFTVVLSGVVAYKFHQYKKTLPAKAHDLSGAISWQLVGEAVIGLGTLIFAGAAYMGVLDEWHILTQSALRFIMFLATSTTTAHLMRTLYKLER